MSKTENQLQATASQDALPGPNELRFTIGPEQSQALVRRAVDAHLARDAAKREAMLQRIERVMQYVLKPALLIAPLIGLALWHLTQETGHPAERVIGSIIVALAYVLVWRRFGSRLTDLILSVRRARRSSMNALGAPVVSRLVEQRARRSIARLEGTHRWLILPDGLSVTIPSGASSLVRWPDIVRLHDAGDYYQLFTRRSARFGLAHYLAKRSDDMEASDYDERVQRILERVAVITGSPAA
ncbi:hypothetical protein [Burkholderia stagnalis]|uniref:hypothetical protein n=1 Tax=Burkholderia stagnalis TaxID=1503054 RepID=UPI000A91524E|nr:hypothetical protein [Burkholderia stagnalis]